MPSTLVLGASAHCLRLSVQQLSESDWSLLVSRPHCRIERRADQWAAQLLISPAEYRAAEALVGSSVGALAYELEVTPETIEVWRECFKARRFDRQAMALAM